MDIMISIISAASAAGAIGYVGGRLLGHSKSADQEKRINSLTNRVGALKDSEKTILSWLDTYRSQRDEARAALAAEKAKDSARTAKGNRTRKLNRLAREADERRAA
jgi:hypothetical protein